MKIRALLVAFTLIAGCGSAVPQIAESQRPSTAVSTSVIARLSLRTSIPVETASSDFPQVCFAVDGKGNFMLWRITNRLIPEAFEGTLVPQKLKELRVQLAESTTMDENGAVILRHDGRSFELELPSEKGMVRKSWVAEPLGHASFPTPIEGLADWIYHFDTGAAKPLDVGAQGICPNSDLKPLQPTAM